MLQRVLFIVQRKFKKAKKLRLEFLESAVNSLVNNRSNDVVFIFISKKMFLKTHWQYVILLLKLIDFTFVVCKSYYVPISIVSF